MCLSQQQQKFHKIPYTYLIVQLGQLKILGQADTCLFSTTKMAYPYQIYGKNKDFWVFRKKMIVAQN